MMMTKTAVGYTRVSQDSDTSISDQKREIRDLADEQGLNLHHIYNDGERSSGFNNNRPEYLEMQTALEDGEASILIVRDRDRLSRDKRERSMLFYDLDEWAVELWTTAEGEPVDFDDDETWLIEMIRGYMDDVQKRREIQQARKKVRERIENGYDHGRPPTGLQFDQEGQYWVPDDEFEVVMQALKLRNEGHSYSYIANETGIPRGTLANIFDRKDLYIQKNQKFGSMI